MKTLLRVILALVGLVILLGLGAFADGAMMPEDHSVTVTGTVAAPPSRVFGIITNVGAGASWRPQVKSVEVLPKNNTRDVWIEDLGQGIKMKFLATTSTPVDSAGHAERKVLLQDSPDWAGTWTYDVSPGPSAGTTTLRITEDGSIRKPIYRFMMAHVFGPTKNLDDYMKDIQAVATK
jgi:uncharacterized protein YndB with AHSA1/START domain